MNTIRSVYYLEHGNTLGTFEAPYRENMGMCHWKHVMGTCHWEQNNIMLGKCEHGTGNMVA